MSKTLWIKRYVLARHLPPGTLPEPGLAECNPCPECDEALRGHGRKPLDHAPLCYDGVGVHMHCRQMVAFRRYLAERAMEHAATLMPLERPTTGELLARARECERVAFGEIVAPAVPDQRECNRIGWQNRVANYLNWRKDGRTMDDEMALRCEGTENGWTYAGFTKEA
jgi:hypothetical protein